MKLNSTKIGLAALLTTLVECATLNAQIPGVFTQIDMQDGGYLTGIVQHPSGRLIARTDGGGIYSSDNQGNSWTYLSSNMVTGAALTADGVAVPQTTSSSSNLILQACGYGTGSGLTDPGRGIWKSTDGGATWTHTLTGVNCSGGDNERIGGECMIFHPTNDSEVWFGSRGQGMYESLNAGSTWAQVGSSTFSTNIFSSVYIHPSYPDQIFAGGDGGLWASVDHGVTWTLLKSFTVVYRVTRGADGTVYFGGMNGSQQLIQKITATSWANTATYTYTDLHSSYTSGIGDSGLSIITITVLKDGRLVVGDNDDYTRISSNAGTSFSSISFAEAPGHVVPQWANATTTWNPTCLVQDVNHTNNWYGGAGYGPIATTNSGTNWQYIPNGIGEVVTFKIGFHPTDSNRLYIPCMDLGGAIVTDGGMSGNTVSMAHQFYPSDVVQVSQRALSCKTNGYNRVIFPGGTELNNAARLYASTNDGASWYYPASVGLPTGTSGTVIDDAMDSLDNPDDFLVLVGGNTGVNLGGVYRTTNAGASFTQCNWYPSGTVFIGSTGYRFANLDRDATNVNVRYLFSRASYPSIPPAAQNGGGFFISSDRGLTWTQTTGASGGIVAGDWSNWQGSMMVADHGISGSVWIAVENGSKGLAHSVNSGSSWTWITGFTNALAVDALNGNVVVYGEMSTDAWCKIYYSSNNGTSWGLITRTNFAFGNAIALALDPYRPGRILIGTGERSVGIFTPGTAPSISAQPQSQTNGYGSTATFNVTAGGTAPFNYQWYFGNAALAQGTNASLTLTNLHVTNSGSYNVVVSSMFGSAPSSNAILTVTQAVPVLTWPHPADITYGTALSSVQLNATANVPGAFAYNPLAGYVLAAGNNQTLSVTFTPSDTLDYSNATATVTINVQPAPPSIGSVSLSGTNLVINGANLTGDSNFEYIILSSSDMTLPIAQWTPVASNGFATNGTFCFSNAMSASQPAMYFTFYVTNLTN